MDLTTKILISVWAFLMLCWCLMIFKIWRNGDLDDVLYFSKAYLRYYLRKIINKFKRG